MAYELVGHLLKVGTISVNSPSVNCPGVSVLFSQVLKLVRKWLIAIHIPSHHKQ